MKGSSHFPIRKKCPIGYQGRKCLVACCSCDRDWIESFLVQLKDVLYVNDPENLECELWKKKKCLYMFISFPYGDAPLVWFIMAGMNLICMDWKGSPMNAKHLRRVDPKSELMAIHNGLNWMMDAYSKKEYNKVAQLSNLVIPNTSGFFMFMSVLNAFALSNKDMNPVVSLGADKYVAFHRQHNGVTSPEYGYALLLRVYCTGDNGQDLDEARKLVPEDEPLVYYLCGLRWFKKKDYYAAHVSFAHTHPKFFPTISLAFQRVALWNDAYLFAERAHYECPSEENKLLFAQCAYAVGKRSVAIKALGPPYKNKKDLFNTWQISSYRICEHCHALLQGEMNICPICEEAFYCNEKCADAGLDYHMKTACRCCRVCLTDLSGSAKQRLRCSGCYLAVYCSAECQLRDWNEEDHKNTCN